MVPDIGICYKKGFKYQLSQDYQVCVSPHLLATPEALTGFVAIKHAWGHLGKLVVDTKFIRLVFPEHNGPLELRILEGYAWDGPSGPTWDTTNWMRASLIHDALYQLMRMGLLRFDGANRYQADVECLKALKEDGMWAPRRALVWVGLRTAARFAANPKNARRELAAPAKKYKYLDA